MPSAEQATTWTTRKLLAWITEAFAKNGIDSPRLSSEILLSHVLKTERLKLYTDPDRPASKAELDALRALASRGLKHEPIQYLTGEAWFFGLPFTVDRRVLIPRPSTETIVETVLQEERRQVSDVRGQTEAHEPDASHPPSGTATEAGTDPSPDQDAAKARHRSVPKQPPGRELLIADICTGSGCIAIALLKNLPRARCIATDISPDALAVARLNAQRHNVLDRLELLQGELLTPLGERVPGANVEGVDVLVTNPPYIPDHEWESVEPNVKDHEPTAALRAGVDGLQFVKPLLSHAPALLKPGGLLLIEIAASTADTVLEAAKQHSLLDDVKMLKDSEGHPRILHAFRRQS